MGAPSDTIKLSSPATRDFWEIPVLFEDEHLLALNKPANLFTSPDRYDPNRPNLIQLLHRDIERGAPWAAKRGTTYLFNAHRLDLETSGVILFAKSKPVLVELANLFGSEKPNKIYVALVQGTPPEDQFATDAKLSPHPVRPGVMRVDQREGKRSRTEFTIRERFNGITLLECRPLTARTHQVRIHLAYLKLPILGDKVYGGSELLLSSLKSDYRLKRNQVERPLIATTALHAEQLTLAHPVTGNEVKITAEWPKDLNVAVKFLRRYAAV
ncbi:MAG: RluA family pseudouridine synthase [Verrucomicrobia bacterium]|nr:RluA family pseudouridine synthase [Verrucomicrobiota bacterium]